VESKSETPSLIVILGETASGKTAVSIEIAKQIGGEIICADSRTVYKHMDIGTAKPTLEERNAVPHHLLDLRYPNESFSAAEFKELAQKCIQDISLRNKIPIMVGGTGLYIDSVLYNFQFVSKKDPDLRRKLEQMDDEEITTFINNNKIDISNVNTKNRRHMIRFIERGAISPTNHELRPNTLILGLRLDRQLLKDRIAARIELMFQDGFLDEVESLVQRYGWDNQAMSGIGYKVARDFFEGHATTDQVKQAFIQRDISLAKRQRTWFKRNENIHWFNDSNELAKKALNFCS